MFGVCGACRALGKLLVSVTRPLVPHKLNIDFNRTIEYLSLCFECFEFVWPRVAMSLSDFYCCLFYHSTVLFVAMPLFLLLLQLSSTGLLVRWFHGSLSLSVCSCSFFVWFMFKRTCSAALFFSLIYIGRSSQQL